MKCGHAANATNSQGKPSCVICVGIHPGAEEIDDTPDLNHRQAQCAYCRKTVASSTDLAFFNYLPNKPFDDYYCGCKGWD